MTTDQPSVKVFSRSTLLGSENLSRKKVSSFFIFSALLMSDIVLELLPDTVVLESESSTSSCDSTCMHGGDMLPSAASPTHYTAATYYTVGETFAESLGLFDFLESDGKLFNNRFIATIGEIVSKPHPCLVAAVVFL